MTLQVSDAVTEFAQHFLAGLPPADLAEANPFTLLPELFAPEEVGWLAQEGRAAIARLSGRPKEAPSSIDLDLHEEAFRRLVSHPRLLAALGRRDLKVAATRLVIGRGETARPGDVAVALSDGALRIRHERVAVSVGSVLLLDTDAVVEHGDCFLIAYGAAGRPLGNGHADDCLWPSPMACAG